MATTSPPNLRLAWRGQSGCTNYKRVQPKRSGLHHGGRRDLLLMHANRQDAAASRHWHMIGYLSSSTPHPPLIAIKHRKR